MCVCVCVCVCFVVVVVVVVVVLFCFVYFIVLVNSVVVSSSHDLLSYPKPTITPSTLRLEGKFL